MNPAPGFMEAFLHVCKTVNFKGRARRAEYWKFILLWNLFYIPMYLINMYAIKAQNTTLMYAISGLLLVICLGLFLQSLSLVVRRLHDTDHSGWCMLVSLIPLVGFFILFYWLVKDSTNGTNQYGPSPKYSDANSSSKEIA